MLEKRLALYLNNNKAVGPNKYVRGNLMCKHPAALLWLKVLFGREILDNFITSY